MIEMSTVKVPAGTYSFLAAEGKVIAGGFDGFASLEKYLNDEQRKMSHKSVRTIAGVSEFLRAYADGDLRALSKIKVKQNGGEFYQKVWGKMRLIAPGKISTYQELAEKAGNPRAMRATGSACARNAIALIVPCHRVIKSDGSLGNYAYGIWSKEELLKYEGYIK
jgi:methylated-DNA-[protein]-cysteine S-methyltransferase